MHRRLGTVPLAVCLLTACSADRGGIPNREALVPRFARTSAPSPAPAVGTPAGSPTPFPIVTSTVGDGTNDIIDKGRGAPPTFVDILSARVTRNGARFSVLVRLGGTVPKPAALGGRTLHVAAFFDRNLDGTVDYEVWAALSKAGWSGRSFVGSRESDRKVKVEAATDSVTIALTLRELGTVRAFQWAVATRWGDGPSLEKGRPPRDVVPDRGRAAKFLG